MSVVQRFYYFICWCGSLAIFALITYRHNLVYERACFAFALFVLAVCLWVPSMHVPDYGLRVPMAGRNRWGVRRAVLWLLPLRPPQVIRGRNLQLLM